MRPEELAHILWQKDFLEEILMLAGNRSREWALTTSATADQLPTNIENMMLFLDASYWPTGVLNPV